MTSPRKGPCSPRAQPPWKTTRVRERESPGHLSDLASSSQQLVRQVNEPCALLSSSLYWQRQRQALRPAFLFLLTKRDVIGLPWLGARPARHLPASVLPWQWRCAFCQGSSWWMGSDYLPSRFTSSKVQAFLWKVREEESSRLRQEGGALCTFWPIPSILIVQE